MTSPVLEIFLARLYTDPDLLDRFLADPDAALATSGLTPSEVAALHACDTVGLRMAAASFARKRASYRRGRQTMARRLLHWLQRALAAR